MTWGGHVHWVFTTAGGALLLPLLYLALVAAFLRVLDGRWFWRGGR